MENLVGDNLPSAEKIAAMLKKCIELRTEVSKLGIVLSPDQRKRRLRMRKGAMALVPLLISLVKKQGLEVASVPLAGMQADARLSTELSPFEDHVTALSHFDRRRGRRGVAPRLPRRRDHAATPRELCGDVELGRRRG